MSTLKLEDLSFRQMTTNDIRALSAARGEEHRVKTLKFYETSLAEQEQERGVVIIAETVDTLVGHCVVSAIGSGGSFKGKGVPQLQYLHVVEDYRCQGIGAELLNRAENAVKQWANEVFLAVDFCAPEPLRFFVKHGYVPDKTGVWNGRSNTYFSGMDDPRCLTLYLSKKLEMH